MTHQALCQDCLRAPTFTSAADLEKAHTGKTHCTCGGDLCACDGCLETIRRLAAGERGQIEGITCIVSDWTAENGLARKP